MGSVDLHGAPMSVAISGEVCFLVPRSRESLIGRGQSETRRMTRPLVTTALLGSILAACVATPPGEPVAMFRLPVTGQFGSTPAAGQVTAFNNGVGTFWVQTPGGARCTGEYQVRDPNPALVLAGKCTNGKHGQIVVTRTPDLMSGSAIVKLSDGTRGQFVFGNLTYGQAFGQGGVATIR